ncbi:MAG TPA: DUF5666 domain-containing protein [Aliidongia sp.]|nr:DUF5666 domain-containing protein [Aliidongia sp.]
MRLVKSLIVALAIMSAVPAWAQAPEGTRMRIRGTVERLEGQTLIVKSRSGDALAMNFPAGTMVVGMVKSSLADIKSGDFVGVTSINGENGERQALEVHIFPEAMRGTNEGQVPWDLTPDSLMTNGAISGSASAAKGQKLTVNYKGRETEVTVTPQTPIVAFAPADASLLKPGAAVLVQVLKQPDGSMTVLRVNAEKDGVKPPM